MKLVGELKEKVEKAEDLTEAKQAIENAGMELTEDELNSVAGGITEEESRRMQRAIWEDKLLHTDGDAAKRMYLK